MYVKWFTVHVSAGPTVRSANGSKILKRPLWLCLFSIEKAVTPIGIAACPATRIHLFKHHLRTSLPALPSPTPRRCERRCTAGIRYVENHKHAGPLLAYFLHQSPHGASPASLRPSSVSFGLPAVSHAACAAALCSGPPSSAGATVHIWPKVSPKGGGQSNRVGNTRAAHQKS